MILSLCSPCALPQASLQWGSVAIKRDLQAHEPKSESSVHKSESSHKSLHLRIQESKSKPSKSKSELLRLTLELSPRTQVLHLWYALPPKPKAKGKYGLKKLQWPNNDLLKSTHIYMRVHIPTVCLAKEALTDTALTYWSSDLKVRSDLLIKDHQISAHACRSRLGDIADAVYSDIDVLICMIQPPCLSGV